MWTGSIQLSIPSDMSWLTSSSDRENDNRIHRLSRMLAAGSAVATQPGSQAFRAPDSAAAPLTRSRLKLPVMSLDGVCAAPVSDAHTRDGGTTMCQWLPKGIWFGVGVDGHSLPFLHELDVGTPSGRPCG